MPDHSIGRVHHPIPAIDQRKERIVFFPALDRGPQSETLVEAGPYVPSLTTEGHVASVADATEIRALEPVRSIAVDNELFLTPHVDVVVIRSAVEASFQGTTHRSHDLRVLELPHQR